MAWSSDGTWTAEDDGVSKRVTGLMSQDSPLMRQATTAGMTTASRRGLINSSIAAGAAQDAALKYVVPIASQEASQISTANNNLANNNASAAQLASSLASQEKISAENNAADWQKTQASLASQEKLNTANLNSDWQKTQASLASQEKIATANNQAEADKTASTLKAQERAALVDALTKAQDSYTTGITNTLQNDKITAATRNSAQADIAARYSAAVKTLESIYGTTLSW